MAHIITHNLASLPIYQDGFAVGRDTGLRLALDQLTQERLRQERLLARVYPTSTKAARISYAEASLREVSKQVAGIFRTHEETR
jgi:hypothetical protein